MESLFGEKHNVNAAATRELGAVIDDNPSGTPPTNEAESETSSDEESCAGTDICSDDERDVPAAGSDGQRGVEREAGSGVEREAEPHAPHAAPFAGARNDRRDDAFVGGADAGTGSRNAGRAADHVAGGATDAGGSSENNRAIDGDEPEFRFDSYSPPPPPSTANRSSENVGDRVQAEFEPEALVMYNELGLSDEDLRDLQSRLVAEQNCVVPDHQQAAPPHAARTNTKKQSQKRSSSKVSGSKKNIKQEKEDNAQACTDTNYADRGTIRGFRVKKTRSSRKQHMETAFRSQLRTQRTRRSEMLYLNGVSNKKRTKRTSDTCDGSKNRKRPSESKKPCAAMSCSGHLCNKESSPKKSKSFSASRGLRPKLVSACILVIACILIFAN
ncbi:hypothetical protein PF008_g31256 [Phytophthora fragariae]|uniref:Uncharacterized protein n=1 Tax=Phytophthora fragariae TaxID=53985 RepID=A0A6G0Q368_9STRA|nr:hypothetical protein PF008_g31256 [Phytophthora fragariae]